MASTIIYVGVKAHVTAIDQHDGKTLWTTKLKTGGATGDRFVTLLVDGGCVYAHTYGELFCLDAATGQLLWKNPLEGLGYGIVSLAAEGVSSSLTPSVVRQQRIQAESVPPGSAGGADS